MLTIIISLSVLTLFLIIGYSIDRYSNLDSEEWTTLHVERKIITIDNRESAYYKRWGFHEYDTMHDIDEYHCVYKVQKSESGKFRVKDCGDRVDVELERKAYEVMNNMSKS